MARRKLGVKPAWLSKAEETRKSEAKLNAMYNMWKTKFATTEAPSETTNWTFDLTTESPPSSGYVNPLPTSSGTWIGGTLFSSGVPGKFTPLKLKGGGTFTFAFPPEPPPISRAEMQELADRLVKERYPGYRP